MVCLEPQHGKDIEMNNSTMQYECILVAASSIVKKDPASHSVSLAIGVESRSSQQLFLFFTERIG